MNKKYDYDVTVVVPVYNASEYLRDCVDSLINQTHEFSKIEVILINDGSSDNSIEICREYENKYNNIIVFDNENHGVSYSRNQGIKKAQGKYIALLDSDDFLSKTAIHNLYNFFENHYEEVDLITYNLVYFTNNEKYNLSKKYEKYDKGTGVYDLDEYPYLDQCTVNIIFKKENNIYFDETMFSCEDQKFDTVTIMKKRKIGYVAEANYNYRKIDSSVSSTRTNPFYSYDLIINYWEWLISNYKDSEKLAPYIQALILSHLNYRILQDILFPYHFGKKEYSNAYNRIINVIGYIDTEIIMNFDGMDFYHKIYVLNLQRKPMKIHFDEKGNYCLSVDGVDIYKNKYVQLFLNRFKVRKGKIDLMGYMSTPIHQCVKPNLYLSYTDVNGKTSEIEMDIFESNCSYYKTSIKTNSFYGFSYAIDYNNIKEFHFYTLIDNKKIYMDYEFSKWVAFNKKIGRYYIVKENKEISYDAKERNFKIVSVSFYNRFLLSLKNTIRYIKKNPKVLAYRSLYHHRSREIWLYSDNKGIFDNAYKQFQHDFEKNDGVKRYYIYYDNENIVKERFTSKQRKYLVPYGSFKHKKLFLNAEKIITSFSDFSVYSPFQGGYYWYNDIVHYDLIYLQYGILHATLKKIYSREFTEIEKIVISSEFEKNNFIENYHYQSKDFICAGMSRFTKDFSNNKKKNKKIILIPSWRKHLIGSLYNGKRKLMPKQFLESNFYQKINEFLNSEELDKLLEKYHYTLDFKLHPIFKEYEDLFESNNRNVFITSDEVNVADYALCITDFSSFQFDFAWHQIPIIYFMPDILEFKAGLHSYRELDLSYEDALGPYCESVADVLKEIEKLILHDRDVDTVYKERQKKFFTVSKNPTETIYNSLKNE